jgi:hypothetical protein
VNPSNNTRRTNTTDRESTGKAEFAKPPRHASLEVIAVFSQAGDWPLALTTG